MVLKQAVRRLFGRSSSDSSPRAAMVLSGGGARAAYQAGVIHYIAETFPEAQFPVLNGVSAGAINAAHLANHTAPFDETAEGLVESWHDLTTRKVFRARSGLRMLWTFLRHASSMEEEEGELEDEERHAFLSAEPLRSFLKEKLNAPDGILTGVETNLEQGRLHAISVVTTNYTTGQTVTWVQGDDITMWERPNRISTETRLTVDHIMASTALPLFFPAVQLDGAWYGDGGIRLDAPLAPAIHMGADRILVISTRYSRSRAEADRPAIHGYPPPAQILGILADAIFLDVLDQDADMAARINKLAKEVPPEKRGRMRPVRLLVIRPSQDLGKLSGEYEPTLPVAFRLLARGLGTGETESPDWLSLLLFEPDYIDRLIEVGYEDARDQRDDIEEFLTAEVTT